MIQAPSTNIGAPKAFFSELNRNGNIGIRYDISDQVIKEYKVMGITANEINTVLTGHCFQKNADVLEILNWDLNTLIDYITSAHQFTKKNAVTIYDLAQKVAYRHGNSHKELNEFVTVMFFFLHDLLNHIMKEEQILFQNIRQVLKDNKQSDQGVYTTFGLIKDWIKHMKREHQSSCKYLMLLNALTNNYSTPSDASSMYRILLRLMREFEQDFLQLTDIENNILFPKALVEDGESVLEHDAEY